MSVYDLFEFQSSTSAKRCIYAFFPVPDWHLLWDNVFFTRKLADLDLKRRSVDSEQNCGPVDRNFENGCIIGNLRRHSYAHTDDMLSQTMCCL